MASPSLILAVDQGTSATKCALINEHGTFVWRVSIPLEETHPHAGWVEQDPDEIWHSVQSAVAACLENHEPQSVRAVGLSTQRESMLLWDRTSGRAVSPLISWQDQRGTHVYDAIRSDEIERLVRRRSGLPLDPMFSAVKARWLLDQYDPDRIRAGFGDLCLGTVDSWLLSRLGGDHLIEVGNASRTQLLNIHTLDWDDDLLDIFGVPRACLPRVVASTGPFPTCVDMTPLPDGVPIGAVMGDSHAALFGHGAFGRGQIKATYGTGSSIMGVLDDPMDLTDGLCLTVGWMTDRPVYAAEGNIRSAGSTLRWLASILEIEVSSVVALGLSTQSDGVVLVPGFGGLGAPWWDRDAVGLVTNLTLGTTRGQIARAAVESIVFQVADVVEAIAKNVGAITDLFVDGAPTRSDGLIQMQADRLHHAIQRAKEPELSALGVAHLAGMTAGMWSREDLRDLQRPFDHFEPSRVMHLPDSRAWLRAVERAASHPLRGNR